MANVYCLNPIADVGMNLLPQSCQVTDTMDNADAVLVRSAQMHDLELPESLLCIARAGAGVNNIPLNACAEKGIVVFNTPGANANGVKELVMAGLLFASRDIIGGANWVQENKNDSAIAKTTEKAKKAFAGCEVKGKKLGVIGLGAIGVLVANAAHDLGMDVYGCDPYLSIQNAVRLSRYVNIVKDNDEIFSQCDYITLHVPALDSTKGMINASAFEKMKDGVVILNFARDLLVNDTDMAAALASGKVRRYVSDFPNPAVANMPGAVVLPHLGASTEESEDNCAVMAVKQIADYLENGNIVNSVNYPACTLGNLHKPARICVAHYNKPNVISQFTTICGNAGVNISDMVSKSRGDYAYAMFDVESPISEDFEHKIAAMDNIIKVRIINGPEK
ncbi:MAG: 3-phosphoglycerate dehydrogenase [Lachnospiraceae bacterium]|nr:3-phosphoglycerate dehydrogenase [Lachnospiraceae bacterium]